jgi:sec-independent protein translocase protein TatA
MGGKLGAGEIILIVGIALLFFGPAKLPELGKSIGKSIREFKGAISGGTGDGAETKPEPTTK